MKKVLMMITLALALVHASFAQHTLLVDEPLAALPDNPSVMIEEIVVAPGRVVPPHRHDAYLYIYVLEGALDMQVEGGEVTRVDTGELFVERPDDIHVLMNNPSDSAPARILVMFVKSADLPVGRPVDVDAP